jgi:hypothetical protein
VIANELVKGMTCFQVCYPDSSLTRPIVITYEFCGTGTHEGQSEQVYFFKFIPAFTQPDDLKSAPVVFAEAQPHMLNIDELIAELKDVARRVEGAAPG